MHRRTIFVLPLAFLILLVGFVPTTSRAQQAIQESTGEPTPTVQKTETELIKSVSKKPILNQIIVDWFRLTHNGFSADEVFLQDELNKRFIAACLQKQNEIAGDSKDLASASDFNWQLMNLRKAGKLRGIKTTRRRSVDTSDVAHIAEIVTRTLQDKHRVTTDRIMADPDMRQEFDRIAKTFEESIDIYSVRKAAFQLRKTRKLKPELITRIADWKREISTFELSVVKSDISSIPELPGIYIFRDGSGYLYIGQSNDLRKRLQSHLDDSSNMGLARYLTTSGSKKISIEIHSFPKDSRAMDTMVRRAYESELIRSRKPKFNISP